MKSKRGTQHRRDERQLGRRDVLWKLGAVRVHFPVADQPLIERLSTAGKEQCRKEDEGESLEYSFDVFAYAVKSLVGCLPSPHISRR